jgi:hypothetical protein
MTGYVYFFESGDGLIKIGKANDVNARFNQLKTACPNGLNKLGHINVSDPYKLEKQLHRYFKKYRQSGEWFKLPGYLKSDIVHNVRMKFDEVYCNDFKRKERDKELFENGYLESAGSNDSYDYTCHKCGCDDFHLLGIYTKEDTKYTCIINLVECEDCKFTHGTVERFGKGTMFKSAISVIRIPEDWKKIN